jgi:ribosomal protein S12 methylthiotransferase
LSTDYQTLPTSPDVKGRYSFISLGCAKNTVDSERMMGLLKLDGYQLISDPEQSDFVVVNTCGFIEQAREESFGAIDEMLTLKKAGKTKGVIVTGCLAERQKEDLLKERPEIDALIGVFGRDKITQVADRLLGDQAEQRVVFQPAPIRALSDQDRLQITPKHFAYLKISEGCDRLCTFCAIPKMRGKHATKPMEEVIAEAKQLAASGVRELIIVAQDTTYYGMDMYGEPRLAELLTELNKIDGFDWIRLMYFYPMYIDEKLMQVIADSDKILPYIDMPLQHGDNTMLRRMSRRVNVEDTEKQIAIMRKAIPNLILRTTFITGFPGETEEQFQNLVDFTRRHHFERMGVFTYSFEPDTPAARMDDHLEDDVKNDRRDRLMAVQQEIMFEHNQAQIGKTIDVILDAPVPDQPGAWIGRGPGDAPDVDGLVFVTQTEHELGEGDIVPCEIVTTQGYDLIAVATGAPRKRKAALNIL